MKYLLEVCVDSLESARRAAAAGADRLELCADLLVGGTSPSPFLIRQVLDTVNIPVNVLLRPRFGDFCYTPEEKAVLLDEIDSCRELGVHGVVIGALLPDGSLDADFLRECIAHAGPLHRTLHRCFDVCRDAAEALEQAAALGFDTILTSGQAAAAPEGAALLTQLVRQAGGRLAILAGSGVNAGNIPALAAQTGARQFHLSGKHDEPGPMQFKRPGVPMGLPMADEFTRQYTDPAAIRAARAALDKAAGLPPLATPEGVVIRRAGPADAAGVLACLAQLGGETDNLTFGAGGPGYSAEAERAFLRGMAQEDRACMMVAQAEDGRIVGTASLSPAGGARMAHRGDLSVAVLRDFWHRGLGAALMAQLIRCAQAADFTVLELEVRADNARAIALYQRLGFVRTGDLPRFFRIDGAYVDAVRMQLDL